MTRLWLILILIQQTVFVQGQTKNIDWCGYDKLKDKRSSLFKCADSTYLNAINQINISNSKLYKTVLNNKIYQIPVVFHILHFEKKENIADSIILSQLDILNKAFLNSDTSNIRDIFRNVKGNPKIQFVLSQKTPNGQSTTGINRVKTTHQTFNIGDSLLIEEKMKFTDMGGVDAWDTDNYLNIWVCNLQPSNPNINEIFGYAYPPINAKYWDVSFYKEKKLQGIVIHYRVVGLNNPEKQSGINTGVNTLVHEVGHYLGLRHTWVDNADCSQDDFLWDTPQAASPSYYCNYGKNTCHKNNPFDLPDMIENYMDYTQEKCLKMFTKEQTSLMNYNLIVNRNELFNFLIIGKPEQKDENNIICLYPNPAKNYIYLEKCLHEGINSPIMYGQITDILGNIINSFTLNDITTKIDILNLNPGFYFVSIKFNDLVEVIKFIKT